ncbi:hypothetical protein PVAP13_9KG272565 [Panicum virgatum]|uniref:Uncharacterized protein n=1 Tax=Panicum virgatum TaxID=38727 RepID=A0A8T0NKF1_PANVG|nr:hypothetical protein PVAP13_9KG272565 [Panicum virgatum]
MSFHLRSVSFPSKRCSNEAEVQDELQSLEASVSCRSATIEVMCDGLRRLGDVYSHIEEMIHLPSSQVCSIQQRKELDGELENSLELIDLCNAMQENFAELKTIIQDLLVVFRRGDDASAQAKIQSYICLVRKAMKQFKKTSKKTTCYKEGKLVRLLTKARLCNTTVLYFAPLPVRVAVAKLVTTPLARAARDAPSPLMPCCPATRRIARSIGRAHPSMRRSLLFPLCRPCFRMPAPEPRRPSLPSPPRVRVTNMALFMLF